MTKQAQNTTDSGATVVAHGPGYRALVQRELAEVHVKHTHVPMGLGYGSRDEDGREVRSRALATAREVWGSAVSLDGPVLETYHMSNHKWSVYAVQGTELYSEQGSIDLDAGDVGGDIQATDAASRRFARRLDAETWEVVDIYAFGTEETNSDDVTKIDVSAMTTTTTCTDVTDPGGTEIGAEMEYAYPFDFGPRDLDQARVWAVNYVRTFDPTHL